LTWLNRDHTKQEGRGRAPKWEGRQSKSFMEMSSLGIPAGGPGKPVPSLLLTPASAGWVGLFWASKLISPLSDFTPLGATDLLSNLMGTIAWLFAIVAARCGLGFSKEGLVSCFETWVWVFNRSLLLRDFWYNSKRLLSNQPRRNQVVSEQD